MKTTTVRYMKQSRLSLAIIATLATGRPASLARAELVSDYFTMRGTAATTLSGTGNTANPSLGTTTTTSQAARMIGYFSPQTLTNVGDKITLSFSMTLNDGSAYGTAGQQVDNFRFALFDRSNESTQEPANSNILGTGSANVDTFRGYWFGVKTANTGAQGSIRERNSNDNDPFIASSTALLGTASGTNVVFTGLINNSGTSVTYSGLMTLTVTATGLDLSGSFTGNGGANSFSFLDTTPITTTFGAVGFLNGGGLNADQLNFQDVSVIFTAVPEAASVAMFCVAGIGSGLTLLVRRRIETRKRSVA